jgi:hypothetical protein
MVRLQQTIHEEHGFLQRRTEPELRPRLGEFADRKAAATFTQPNSTSRVTTVSEAFSAALLRTEKVKMTSIRRSVLVVGAAAFLSSQAAYAAPVARPVDPLVSLAILGGAQAHSAVCAGATAATAAAAAAAQAAAPGCILPITGAPPPPAAVAPPPPPPPVVEAGAPKSIGVLPILIGLAALAAVVALIISNNDNNNGNVTPVSPA